MSEAEAILVNTPVDGTLLKDQVKLASGAVLVPPAATKLILSVESIKTGKEAGENVLVIEMGVTTGHTTTVPLSIGHVVNPFVNVAVKEPKVVGLFFNL